MKTPVLDPRDVNRIMQEIAAHAAQYTPEWRYEDTEDDPGAAIAKLFGEMFYQTLDRFNSVPEKLYTDFLELIGVQMPDPLPAKGLLHFETHDTIDEPVPVPQGTQAYRSEDAEDGVIYETDRAVEATPARLTHLYFSDNRKGVLQKLDLAQPQYFFTVNPVDNLQCHRFVVDEQDVLAFRGAGTVKLQILAETNFAAEETAQLLTGKDMRWTYRRGEEDIPFDRVEREGDCIYLIRTDTKPLENQQMEITVTSVGAMPAGTVLLDGIQLSSAPADWCGVDGLASDETVIDQGQGGYCFGRRPTPYQHFYIQSDQAFRKRGAQINLKLDVTPVISEPEKTGPTYNFSERLIDKKAAVEVRPDDVFVDDVVWEYYNGSGWMYLPVTGNRNPFSCKDEGSLETIFTVPEDLCSTEVNAKTGYFIRARVLHVENEFSQTPRWLIPFVRQAWCKWHYSNGRPATRYYSNNNGTEVVIEDAANIAVQQFPAIISQLEEPCAMYLCFDASPHAMPLSIYFELAGKAPMDDKLSFEAWNGKRFEPVNVLDQTRNLLHSGVVLLYLPNPLPKREMFGRNGCWLRMIRSTYLDNSGGYPRVSGIHLNTVTAVQRKQEETMVFDTDVYEAGKKLQLLEQPVQDCVVWVDEVQTLALAEAEALAEALPEKVRMEYTDHVLAHCWVQWSRTNYLELCSGEDRVYHLDPYSGVITFGDGIHGKVPAVGQRNISVEYASGGGAKGNCPAGVITQLVGALPRINAITNLTAMSGGTDVFQTEKIQQLGNKRLRHRNRALGVRDYEEMVAEAFPQAMHVRCFSRRDEQYREASGHVTVVVDGWDGGTADLCDRIYTWLAQRSSCTQVQSGRLHVIPATKLTVNTEVLVEVEDLDRAAITQQQLDTRLRTLVEETWRKRDIGDQVRVDQLWQVVRDTPNVRLIRKILVEGVYEQNGITRSIPLESDQSVPYATVRAGSNKIRLG